MKLYVTREAELESNMKKVYGLIKGQCSVSLRAAMKTKNDYESKNSVQDVLWLFKTLQALTSGLDSKGNKRSNLFDALFGLITMKQGETESNSAYMKRFHVNLDTLISSGGKHILCSPELVEAIDKNNITAKEKEIEESRQ